MAKRLHQRVRVTITDENANVLEVRWVEAHLKSTQPRLLASLIANSLDQDFNTIDNAFDVEAQ